MNTNTHSYVTIDVETEAIGDRPGEYPPKPVGVAIRWPDGVGEYLAWRHPAGNNCTLNDAVQAVRDAYAVGIPIFHNAAFDLEVIETHFGIPTPTQWHDTLLLAFLKSPDELTFALKPLAAKWLNMPPEQRDLLHEWIVKNVPGATKKTAAAYISKAPVALVGPYAVGDVERTYRLFEHLHPSIAANMPAPYDRERRLLPHLVAAERHGIRVNRELLVQWQAELANSLRVCDQEIQTRLHAPGLNLDSDDALADALAQAGVINHWETPDGVVFPVGGGQPQDTPFGSTPAVKSKPLTRSTSKGALKRCCTDAALVNQLQYRNAAATMLRTFVEIWLLKSALDGRLHCSWHQVRGQEKNGTRTGRIASSDPNLANIPNPNETPPPFGLSDLPALRKALLPEPGCVWVRADYNQQELRITSHYENGVMQKAYQDDPTRDLHAFAQQLIKAHVGLVVSRKQTKTVAFASIYGAGLEKLAAQLGVSEAEAHTVREAYFAALPGLRALIERVKERVRTVGWVRSLGGRVLPVESPKLVKGRWRTFDYKMPNKLIQGSAADQTKQALVDFCERGGKALLSTVYDEINISVPVAQARETAELLRGCMVSALPLDVPMLVDLESGDSYGDLSPMTFDTPAAVNGGRT